MKKSQTNDVQERLRGAIHRELDRCDPAITPGVCARISAAGYRAVEDEVINLVITQGIGPSAAIGLLDSEWSQR